MKTSLRRLGLLQLLALGLLALSIGVLAFFATNAQIALCAFRGDLERRVASNEVLLEDSSDPIIRAYGLQIPRSVLENNVRSQEATLRSLDGLWCRTGKEGP